MKIICCSITILLLRLATAGAADLTSSGDFNETIDAVDLIAGAGTDLISEYPSATGATTLTIANTAGGAWRIKARRADNTWHNNVQLFIRRTSNGSGSGTVAGGDSYMQLTGIDTEIFSGSSDRSNVTVQYKLTGMSKAVSPSLYSSTIIFTIE